MLQFNRNNRSHPLLSGLSYAFIALGILTLLISLLLWLTGTKESSLLLYIYIIHGVSLFCGGWIAGKKAGMRGWYHGGLLGILYCAIIILVGFLGFDAPVTMQAAVLALFAVLISAAGGIIGVNSAK